jgi:hypothetical protein
MQRVMIQPDPLPLALLSPVDEHGERIPWAITYFSQ